MAGKTKQNMQLLRLLFAINRQSESDAQTWLQNLQRNGCLADEITSNGIAVPHHEANKGKFRVSDDEFQLLIPHRIKT